MSFDDLVAFRRGMGKGNRLLVRDKARRGSIKLAHRRRHAPHLPASHRIVRIDFENLKVRPHGLV